MLAKWFFRNVQLTDLKQLIAIENEGKILGYINDPIIMQPFDT